MAAEVTIEEMIEEVEREIRLREKIYPRWVSLANPKLSATQAQIQLERLRAVHTFLVQSKV